MNSGSQTMTSDTQNSVHVASQSGVTQQITTKVTTPDSDDEQYQYYDSTSNDDLVVTSKTHNRIVFDRIADEWVTTLMVDRTDQSLTAKSSALQTYYAQVDKEVRQSSSGATPGKVLSYTHESTFGSGSTSSFHNEEFWHQASSTAAGNYTVDGRHERQVTNTETQSHSGGGTFGHDQTNDTFSGTRTTSKTVDKDDGYHDIWTADNNGWEQTYGTKHKTDNETNNHGWSGSGTQTSTQSLPTHMGTMTTTWNSTITVSPSHDNTIETYSDKHFFDPNTQTWTLDSGAKSNTHDYYSLESTVLTGSGSLPMSDGFSGTLSLTGSGNSSNENELYESSAHVVDPLFFSWVEDHEGDEESTHYSYYSSEQKSSRSWNMAQPTTYQHGNIQGTVTQFKGSSENNELDYRIKEHDPSTGWYHAASGGTSSSASFNLAYSGTYDAEDVPPSVITTKIDGPIIIVDTYEVLTNKRHEDEDYSRSTTTSESSKWSQPTFEWNTDSIPESSKTISGTNKQTGQYSYSTNQTKKSETDHKIVALPNPDYPSSSPIPTTWVQDKEDREYARSLSVSDNLNQNFTFSQPAGEDRAWSGVSTHYGETEKESTSDGFLIHSTMNASGDIQVLNGASHNGSKTLDSFHAVTVLAGASSSGTGSSSGSSSGAGNYTVNAVFGYARARSGPQFDQNPPEGMPDYNQVVTYDGYRNPNYRDWETSIEITNWVIVPTMQISSPSVPTSPRTTPPGGWESPWWEGLKDFGNSLGQMWEDTWDGDAGRRLGDRVYNIYENGGGTAEDFGAWNLTTGLASEMTGVNMAAEAVGGADLETEELLATGERWRRGVAGFGSMFTLAASPATKFSLTDQLKRNVPGMANIPAPALIQKIASALTKTRTLPYVNKLAVLVPQRLKDTLNTPVGQIATQLRQKYNAWRNGAAVAPSGFTGRFARMNPNDIRFSQNSAGGSGRAAQLRESMRNGWNGPAVDAVETVDGIVTIDNTRIAIARELGITEVPVKIRLPSDPLPDSMLGRFGDARTWGEALRFRTGNQRPPLPPTGTPNVPRLPN